MVNIAVAQTTSAAPIQPYGYGCPMCSWMMGYGLQGNWTGGAWPWMMMLGMTLFWLLVFVILVLLIIWLVKQIQKQ